MIDIYLGLVHYPVYNKNLNVVASAVTNFDVHDIARSCETYNVRKYYIIHPSPVQQALVGEILSYWREGYGHIYNPDRSRALAAVKIADDVGQAISEISSERGRPITVTTDARLYDNSVSCCQLKNLALKRAQPIFLLLGTGWGIEKSAMAGFDFILRPIAGVKDYNHLSVRSAAAILLDRLAGEEWWRFES